MNKMNTYTLFELVDLALGTPEVGAVSFNVLNLLLKKMLKETRIGERTVRYRSVDAITLMKKILDEKGEISLSDQEEIDEDFEDLESSEDIKVEESTNTDSQIWPAPELQELFTSVQSLEKRFDKTKQHVESLERQLKRTKRNMVTKTELKDGQIRDQESAFDLDGEEFQKAIEDIRDSIAGLANKLKEQEKSSIGSAKEKEINKLCEKAAEEYIVKRQGDFNNRLRSLTQAVGDLYHVVKEILYPQAAGVTKCVTCGRTARLPDLDLISEIPGEIRGDTNLPELVRKRSIKRKENQKKHELKFTLLSLDNNKKAAKLPASKLFLQDQEQPLTSDARIECHNNKKEEKRQDDVFDIEHATSAFMPLRLIPDPARCGTLLADAMHINPDVMSVSIIGMKKPQTLKFPSTTKKGENT